MKQFRWKIYLLLSAIIYLSACVGNSSESPYLNLSQGNLNFPAQSDESLSFKISSNVKWTCSFKDSESDKIFRLSSTSGYGDSEVRVYTKSANNTSLVRMAELIVSAVDISDQTIKLTQEAGRVTAKTEIVDYLEMSNGIACDLKASKDTKYYCVAIFEQAEYDAMSVSDKESAIFKIIPNYPEGKQNSRFEAANNSFIAWYKDVKPATNYYIVTLSYDKDGCAGEFVEKAVATKSLSNQPQCDIQNITYSPQTDKSGYVYEWYVNMGSGADQYLTYACASSEKFPSYKMAEENSQDKGLLLAWQLYKLFLSNQTGEIVTDFNSVSSSGGREIFYANPKQSSAKMAEFKMDKEKDKYLFVSVWARNNSKGFSGVVDYKIYEPKDLIKVTTDKADNITTGDATLYGVISGASSPLSAGFYYGISLGEMNKKSTEVSTSGDYNVKISGLFPGTIYYYMAYASGNGTSYSGDIRSFKTEAPAPVITFADLKIDEESLTFESATASATYTITGDATVSEKGFCFSTTNSIPDKNNSSIAKSTTAGLPFSAKLTGLTSGTKYYLRAYVESTIGTKYSNATEFVTPIPGVTVSQAEIQESSITKNSAYAIADVTTSGGAVVSEKGFCYSFTERSPSKTNSSVVKSTSSGTSITATLSGLTSGLKYYVRAYVEGTTGTVYSDETSIFSTQLKETPKPEYVDLGLSIPWATFNVGASASHEPGGYYAWGETKEKISYTSATYTLSDADESYCTAGDSIMATEYDVASVLWGGKWRMPNFEEMSELVSQCTWKTTTVEGVRGYLVTGKNGNSIFLPFAGCKSYDITVNFNIEGNYWTGQALKCTNPDWPYTYPDYLQLDNEYATYVTHRYYGNTVRPVFGDIPSDSIFSRDDGDWGGKDIDL